MEKTLEQYLSGLTGEQMRAAALKFWAQAGGTETGAETLERWRAGQLKIKFEPLASAEPPTKPPLTGRVVKTITIPDYKVSDFAEAVQLGNFDNRDALGDVIRQFAKERVGLAKAVKIDLVEFDRDWWEAEALTWGEENGKKNPIGAAHLMGIAIKLPDEQREWPIVELGSVRGGRVLCLRGDSDWRRLFRHAVEGRWRRLCLVGFVSE